MNLSVNGFNGFSIFSQRFGVAGMLKSTQEKQERQQKAQSQIVFFEKQKENLKNMQCDRIEDIARKLEMFHSYEDQIAAVKKQYNNEQMFHTMDEARERGEQIAELAEDYAPKTEEERKEEMVEEALGIEEKGGLTESMEAVREITEEMVEEIATGNVEVLDEAVTAENAQRKAQEKKAAESAGKFELTFTGSSVESITQIMTERMMLGNTSLSMTSGLDLKV